MRNKSLPIIIVLCALCLQMTAVRAAKQWEPAGRKEFSKGTLKGTAISPRGGLQLAPPVEKVPGLQANLVWDLVAGPDGTLYAGTGGPAAVYVMRDGKMERLHKSSQKHIMSVLPLQDGRVLAAGTPGGIIYEIGPDGKASIRAELDEKYVWDMARGPQGAAWCATGPEGRLIKVTPDGAAETVLDADQQHIMCLTHAGDGALYAGTAPDGLVLKVQPDGSARILYDAPETEVHTLVADDEGALYAATAAAKRSPGSGKGNSPPSPKQPDKGAAASVKGTPPASNSIYRIQPDRGAARIAEVENALLLSMAFDADGQLLVGTGMNARLLRVSEGQKTGIVTQFEAAEVSALARDSDGSIYAATSTGGGLWHIGSGRAKQGQFLSAIADTKYLSRWGRLGWDGEAPGETSVEVRLRTGNSERPDRYWSGWSEPISLSAGGAIDVPAGRFAQLRVDLSSPSGETPRVWELRASYRQANRRPAIKEAAVNKGDDSQQQAANRKKNENSISLKWKATDPNDDELTYDLFYRSMNATRWKTMAEELEEPKYQWDTNRVPAGRYLVRLVASDRPSRARDEALAAEHLFRPLVVDNLRPSVLDLKAEAQDDGTYRITGQAEDSHSAIKSIRVSRNSGDWKPVFAADGIMDGFREPFTYRTGELSGGEHVFVFAATDQNDNTGSERIVIEVAD